MNEHVLEAIVKLLAIIAKADGLSAQEYRVIERFLEERLHDTAVQHYLALFDSYAREVAAGPGAVEALAVQINRELSLRQKVIILLHLTELVVADHELSAAEEQLMQQVCTSLRIPAGTYTAIRDFLTSEDLYRLPHPELLIIDSQPHTESGPRHLQRKGLPAVLGVLRLPETDLYLCRVLHLREELTLNGEPLREHHVYLLSNGSVIRGELTDPVYYSEVVSRYLRGEAAVQLSFEARDVSYWFGNGRQGLHHIHLAEESGRLVALMGASGSGKSTLLNVLNGNLKPQQGQVLLNGIDIHSGSPEVAGAIGYVPQDDLLIEDLTVYQNLYYAARLCFGKATEEELVHLVENTLARLGLSETRDLKVGNALKKTISGGQRKRLNIGLELLREPAVLFVDEPTSGLSSRDSENILDLLRELTLQGKLVFVVIHQPSSDLFKMFDRLLILDTGGYPIYYGSPVEAVVYFRTLVNQVGTGQGACGECGNVNPEQIFNIIETRVVDEYGHLTAVRKTSPERWYHWFKERVRLPQPRTVQEKPHNSLDIPSRWEQLRVFVSRDLLAKFHNTQYLAINLLQGPLLAALLAYITRYYHTDELTEQGVYRFEDNMNVPSYMFMSVIVALFMGLTISAEEIIKDARIRKREAFLHLSRHSYLLSKVGILFAFSAVQMALYVLVGNYIMGIEGLHPTYWAVLFTAACFANLLGLNISDSFNSVITIYILIPVLLIPQLILGGIVVRFDEVNPHFSREGKVPVIADLMASRWAFEALAVAQFKDNPHEQAFFAFDQRMANADYKTALYLPELQDKLHVAGRLLASGHTDSSLYARNLRVLRNELEKEQRLTPQLRLPVRERLRPEAFTAAVAAQTQQHLEQLRKYYLAEYATASRQKDDVIYGLTATPEASAQFRENIKRYRNERVVDLVTNVGAEKKMVEHNGELIRKVTPVYADPADISHPLDYRAHFYAPTKHFLGRYFATVPFNLAVIWGMTLALYGTLYFRVVRRLLQLKLFGGSRKKKPAAKTPVAGSAAQKHAPAGQPAFS